MNITTALCVLVAARSLSAQPAPDHALLVLANEDNTLSIVSPATLKVTATLPVGPDPHEVIASSDGTTAYISNYGGGAYNTLTVVDLAAKKVLPAIDLGALRGPHETIVGVGRESEGLDVSPDGKEIWVANAGDGTISVIDAASKKVVATLAANVHGANRLKFTPDGRLAFVSSLNKPDVLVLDRATRKEVKRITVGDGAAGILMQPDGARAYVACSPDGYVAVIDLHSLDVVGRIAVGQGPDGLAWVGR